MTKRKNGRSKRDPLRAAINRAIKRVDRCIALLPGPVGRPKRTR